MVKSAYLKNFGFTLAEVLITLGIIGIVAALTLPTLIKQTQGKELEAELKRAYSVIQTALNKMNYDEGQTVNGTNYPSRTFMPKFKKYFKLYNDCNSNSCEKSTNDESGMPISSRYKTYNNNPLNPSMFDDGQLISSDGLLILIENFGTSLYISVDINGQNKKPNRWGHDLFTFQVMNDGKLLPMGAKGTHHGESRCSATSKDIYNGMGCTYRALTDKSYFKNLPK